MSPSRVLVLLSLLVIVKSLSDDELLELRDKEYKPCSETHHTRNGQRVDSFCMGFKDGAFSFPEGTGCLKNIDTCDMIVIGVRQEQSIAWKIGRPNNAISNPHLMSAVFYLSITNSTSTSKKGETYHLPPNIVAITEAMKVIASDKDGDTGEVTHKAEATSAYVLNPAGHNFKSANIIAFKPSRYKVDVNEKLHATMVITTISGKFITSYETPPRIFFNRRSPKHIGDELGLWTVLGISVVIVTAIGVGFMACLMCDCSKHSKNNSKPKMITNGNP